MEDRAEDIARDVAAVGRMTAVPALLKLVCRTTGMGFAAVARVTDQSWTACAVHDAIDFGLGVGGQLDISTTLCLEARAARRPIVIDHASVDPNYCDHPTPRLYGFESYISVPIVLRDGEYFGNLCAIDPRPAKVTTEDVVSLFTLFAELIALQLESDRRQGQSEKALLDALAAGELREQFVAVVGHDLRNPLAAVAASAQLLGSVTSDPKVLKIGRVIQASARRMAGLIDDVLDFARGRLGGGFGVQREPVADLAAALHDVVAELQVSHPQQPIATRIHIDRAVHCDRGRVQQLASNLLGNALTHGAADGSVDFTATVQDNLLQLSVTNQGEPIPAASLGQVFGPFWRRSTASNRHGLGLGLFICSQIVKAHGGTLGVVSSSAEGTTFTARLPIDTNVAPLATPRSEAAPAG